MYNNQSQFVYCNHKCIMQFTNDIEIQHSVITVKLVYCLVLYRDDCDKFPKPRNRDISFHLCIFTTITCFAKEICVIEKSLILPKKIKGEINRNSW